MFADDTEAEHSQSDTASLQRDLYQLEEWEKKWLMEFNPDKCRVLRVTRKREPAIEKKESTPVKSQGKLLSEDAVIRHFVD